MPRRIGRLILIAAFAVMMAVPARALDGFPDAPWVGAIQSALMAFHSAYVRWPADVPELQRYAGASGQPLDLSGFTKLTFSQRAAQSILVEYTTEKPSHQQGVFAVALFEVRPQQRNASDVWYYCSNPAGYYPTVQRCPTQWQTVPASAPSSNQLWYYCANPAGYYPSVPSCPTPWQTVPAR